MVVILWLPVRRSQRRQRSTLWHASFQTVRRSEGLDLAGGGRLFASRVEGLHDSDLTIIDVNLTRRREEFTGSMRERSDHACKWQYESRHNVHPLNDIQCVYRLRFIVISATNTFWSNGRDLLRHSGPYSIPRREVYYQDASCSLRRVAPRRTLRNMSPSIR